MVNQILDITGLIEESMWSYPPPVTRPAIERIASLDGADGWDAHRMTLCTLTGTYLEASAHLLVNGETIDHVAPERFIRPATVLQLPDCAPGYPITPDDLAAAATDTAPRRGDALLVATGWDRMWNQPRFVQDSPHFTSSAMAWLVDTGATVIGGDVPCFDDPAHPVGVNKLLFGAGSLILAPLVKLRQATRRDLLLIALPLRVKGVCGTPCRALLVSQDLNFGQRAP
ncbi:MAG TPA: cyclase family protein [Aggregatilineales bacterium]|nr:cyclase family protein [Aggregatilineales bacterium]